MSGPIVRSGPSPEFSKNWSQVFGSSKKTEDKTEKSKSDNAEAKSESENDETG